MSESESIVQNENHFNPLEKQLSIINIDSKSVLKVFESKGPPLI